MAGFTSPASPAVGPAITSLTGSANKLIYTDPYGIVSELGFGNTGDVLVSTGPTTPPAFSPNSEVAGNLALILAMN